MAIKSLSYFLSLSVFMWRNFLLSYFSSVVWSLCDKRTLPGTNSATPLFHRTSTLLLSLSKIVLEIIRAYSIVKIEVVKRGYCEEKEEVIAE